MPYKPTGRPPGRPRKTKLQTDGAYENAVLGVGNRRDRSTFTRPGSGRVLDFQSLENLYENDGFAARVIDLPADEMVRAGIELSSATDDDVIEAALEELKVLPTLANAVRWADLYGGSVAVLVINDGGLFEDPLNEETIREIEGIRVYDRHQVSRIEKYTDPADKRYGQTKMWLVSPVDTGVPYRVHESRVLTFDGASVPDRVRSRNDGWGNSRLQRVYDELTRLGMSYVWANSLLERAQQAVHGIPGLSDILRQPGGEAAVTKRIDLVDMARSINNTVVVDAGIGGENGETYDLKSTSFSGVTDILTKFENAMAAVAGMPKSLLFGDQSAGLNAGDKVGLENWYASIHQKQEHVLLNPLDRIVTLIMKWKGAYTPDYRIEFCPLYVPSEKDMAEVEYKKAQTRQIYVDIQALDPSEVRLKLEKEGDYEIENVEIDRGEEDTSAA